MADYDAVKATTYKPGDTVAASGIYVVTHDTTHSERHEVTVVHGKASRHAVAANIPGLGPFASHIGFNEHFKS